MNSCYLFLGFCYGACFLAIYLSFSKYEAKGVYSDEKPPFVVDADGSLPFYVLDAYGEFSGSNAGNIHLFGKDGACRALVSVYHSDMHVPKSSGSFSNSGKPKTKIDSSQTSYERINELLAFQPPDSSFFQDLSISENDHGKQTSTCAGIPFSLILPRSISSTCQTDKGGKWIEKKNKLECSYEVLKSGMILLKNYLSLNEQVEIVNMCEELALGFHQPDKKNGGKLRLHMMCLGRKWDPQMKYSSKAATAMIPDKLISLVKLALEDSQALLNSKDELPSMSPDICLVNFYTTAGRLALHQDRDESWESLSRGLPVVSISIGDAAEFLYGDKGAVKKAKKVVLESGDILIFGGKSRLVFHGVKTVIPDSAPLPLLKQTMLRPGRLNLTFRQF